jgi:hypothetical protein
MVPNSDRVLAFITAFHVEHVRSPNHHEIARGLDLAPSSIERILAKLEKDNRIMRKQIVVL